jgi:hypothetical protein
MNPLLSYIRHLIVTAVILAVEHLKLPVEGAEDAAHVIALGVIGTLTWAVVKYAPAFAKYLGLMVAFFAVLLMPSCSTVSSAITGLPIPATSVQRAGQDGAPVILVSSQDLAEAEARPAGTVHGLYDAGAVASKAREIVLSRTK